MYDLEIKMKVKDVRVDTSEKYDRSSGKEGSITIHEIWTYTVVDKISKRSKDIRLLGYGGKMASDEVILEEARKRFKAEDEEKIKTEKERSLVKSYYNNTIFLNGAKELIGILLNKYNYLPGGQKRMGED